MKNICLYAILLIGLLGGAAYAQMPENMQQSDSSAIRERLAMPAEVRALFDDNKAKEAVAEYEKFKKTAQADALDMLMLDAEVYGKASSIEPGASYAKMREDAINKMVEKYPKNTEVLMYTMPDDGNVDKILEVLNKMIEADPENYQAYKHRFNIYREKGMIKEACMDYMALPLSEKAGYGMEREKIEKDCKAFENAEKK